MKGIRFYADLEGTAWPDENNLPDRRLSKRTTRAALKRYAVEGRNVNCVAVLLGKEHQGHDFTQEALVATFVHADSDVSLGSVSREYLRGCRHIDSKTALKLHPRLAARLGTR